jgi:hypothetical protein
VGSRLQKKKMLIQVESCLIENEQNLSNSNIQYEIFIEYDQNNWFLQKSLEQIIQL